MVIFRLKYCVFDGAAVHSRSVPYSGSLVEWIESCAKHFPTIASGISAFAFL
jgi:hypothetical protein